MIAIISGAVLLSWPDAAHPTRLWPALAILCACLAWALDNNFTRRVSLLDATWIASVKGLSSGVVNLGLAWWLGARLPDTTSIFGAMLVGLVAYGVSLVLFVVALRHLGTARTGAYFSLAPFFGALLALAFGEPLTVPLLAAGMLMGIGIWLHMTERHEHEHIHEPMEHSHAHVHDLHHQHEHDPDWDGREPHTHQHRHEPLVHTHPHYPDQHHRH
jgi:drug/metabolite transporter (DMT)-like permease